MGIYGCVIKSDRVITVYEAAAIIVPIAGYRYVPAVRIKSGARVKYEAAVNIKRAIKRPARA